MSLSSQIIYIEGDEIKSRVTAEPNSEVAQKLAEATTLGLTTEDFAEMYAPINGGLIFLIIVAFTYLATKKLKKKTIFVLVCLSLLCSCHKEEIVPIQNTIHVSFENTRGPSNSKMIIDEYGKVKFEESDIIHMFASGIGSTPGRYLGSLSYNPTRLKFIGDVIEWQAGETLYFYYIGNNTINTSGSTLIDLEDQSEEGNDLENIAHKFFVSCFETIAQNNTDKDFVGQLKNLISIAAFDTQEFNDGTNIKILSENGNLKNLIKINIDGSLEYKVAGINETTDFQSGHIIIGHASSLKYIALLPIDKNSPANCNLIFTSNNKISSSSYQLPIAINTLWYENPSHDPIKIHTTNYISNSYIDFPSPEECLENQHVFTVFSGISNPSGQTTKKIVFSQGNLVYDQGRFKQHKNGWEVCNIESNDNINVNSTFDRFGWASSGYTFGQPIYQPYSNSIVDYPSSIGYGYGCLGTGSTKYKQSFHPHPTYRRQDWGWYQFGMDCYDEYELMTGHNTYWRTLGQAEWIYLFNNRLTNSSNLIDYSSGNIVSNARYVKANVEGINGIILFPDEYIHPNTSIYLKYINSNNGIDNNILTGEEFLEMHEAGAEFFPFGGCYDKTTQTIVNKSGQYWSCKTQSVDKAIYCKMNVTEGIGTTTIERYQGLFVRLVFQVEGYVE